VVIIASLKVSLFWFPSFKAARGKPITPIKLWLKRKRNLVINGKKLLSAIRKRKLYKSAGQPHSVLSNLLNQNLTTAQKKNRKWFTDITYVRYFTEAR